MIHGALEVALEELAAGVREFPDTDATPENPRIGEYLLTVGLGLDDETAWCSAFTAFCVKHGGHRIEGVSPAARSWLWWGESTEAALGALAVLWRGEPRGWQGHVGFLLDHTRELVFLLAGNQGNRVSVRAFPKGQVLGYRQPIGGW